MNITSQILRLLNQSNDQLVTLTEVITIWSEGKRDKLFLIEHALSKYGLELVFKESLVNLKDNKEENHHIAKFEKQSFNISFTKGTEEELAKYKQWANEVDCLDFYITLLN